MAREVLIFRHGKAEAYGTVADEARALTKRGRKQARKIGAWLQKMDVLPDQVFSSDADRTMETVAIAGHAAGLLPAHIQSVPYLYLAPVTTLLAVLAQCETAFKRVMIVGHNPGLEELVEYLAGSSLVDYGGHAHIKTGTLIRLSLPDDWTRLASDCSEILDFIYPEALTD